MPTIDVSYKDLCNLIGTKIPMKKLEDEDILYVKGEIEEINGDELKIDIKDTNRPDLLSTEGIAREIKFRHGKQAKAYTPKKSNIVVHVDKSLYNIRPCTVCAVVKGLNITDEILKQMIQLQEKISITFGRNRREIAIGVYDLNKIKPPIYFTSTKPNENAFIPLEFNKKLTPKQILEQHPKGKEYGHLLEGKSSYPIFLDSQKTILSIPPIINSDHTGKITVRTRDLFIECSGFNIELLKTALNVVTTALADRGGKLESVDIVYWNKRITTPDLTPKKFTVKADYINKISGLDLKEAEIIKLLEKSGYKVLDKKINVSYPAYRQDIMHQVDIVEDIIITRNYNKIEPVDPRLPTRGKLSELESFSKKVAELMTGTGLQEVMSYILTNKENIFTKMNVKESQIVEIENPISKNWSVFRKNITPSLMEFLSQNTHREFPQKIFEIGDTIEINLKNETRTEDVRRLAVVLSDINFGYQNATEILDFLMSSLGINYKLVKSTHESMIHGRMADIHTRGKIGIVGEIHPKVLNNWKLELPVVVFEVDLIALSKLAK